MEGKRVFIKIVKLNRQKMFILLMNGRGENVTRNKREKERAWTVRKQEQNPHGKVKSLKELSREKD